ncbi:MAG TPA: Ig-like domain-containing protein [Longimicrobiales bacterium]|nr:Ig-like domain-containing protein [Longimicrobiales bacterium]
MRRVVAGPLLVATAAVACAQPQAPPGGEPDVVAPRVESVRPAPFDTVAPFRSSVVFEFTERISEELQDVRDLEEGVVVSPLTGAVRAERGRRSVEVSLAGGWQPDRVYTITVLPVLRDLFGNYLDESLVLVFSTGAEIPETAIAGFIRDRFTGEPVAGARVRAFAADSAMYQAVADTAGFFALRYLPPGDYAMEAWQDVNQDRGIGFQEPQTDTTAALAAGDTVALELAVMPMDSTPARLSVAEAPDSLTVSLLFDDYFPAGPVDGTATLFALPDSVPVHEGALLHGTLLDSLRAARDTLVAGAAVDTMEALDALDVADTPEAPEPPEAAADTVAADAVEQPPEEPLPSRELLFPLPVPLVPGADYVVVVEGVTNIRGVPGGGGSARFTAPVPPPPEDSVPGDAIRGDTIPLPRDTIPPPRDTAGPPPDTVPPSVPARRRR